MSKGMEAAELNSRKISASSVSEVKQVSSGFSIPKVSPRKKTVCF